jgi:formylglycine-generating enzyme required for sulfatase activity
MDYRERTCVDGLASKIREDSKGQAGTRHELAYGFPKRLAQAALAITLVVSGCHGNSGADQNHDQKQNQEPAAGTVRTNPVDGAVMVYIPAGEFLMGSQIDENPRHTVSLSGYWMYKNSVTVAEYKAFCLATKRRMPPEVVANNHVVSWDGPHKNIYSYTNFNPKWSRDDEPIVNVSWDDAMAYARWANADLPTEAQWEKAARGTDARVFPWGNNFDPNKLWCSRKAPYDAGGTHRVGELGVGPYGTTDMAGTVEQWTKDWGDFDYLKTDHGPDPFGPASGIGRVLRGSSWDVDASSEGNFTTYNRAIMDPKDMRQDGTIGFRCVIGTNFAPAASKNPNSHQSQSGTEAQTSSTPIRHANPDEYYDVDPQQAGFKIVGSMSDFTRDSLGRITDGEIAALMIDDSPTLGVQGNEYPIKLASRQLKDGKIRTADFGVIQVSAPGNFTWSVRMTDNQIAKVQDFLKATKK